LIMLLVHTKLKFSKACRFDETNFGAMESTQMLPRRQNRKQSTAERCPPDRIARHMWTTSRGPAKCGGKLVQPPRRCAKGPMVDSQKQ
jgi:hypothetical protein